MEKLNLKNKQTIVKFWFFESFRLIFGALPLGNVILAAKKSELRKDSNASKKNFKLCFIISFEFISLKKRKRNN